MTDPPSDPGSSPPPDSGPEHIAPGDERALPPRRRGHVSCWAHDALEDWLTDYFLPMFRVILGGEILLVSSVVAARRGGQPPDVAVALLGSAA